MCGIAGLWSASSSRITEPVDRIAGRMCDVLQHRGPDGSGIWKSAEHELALSHRRLSIVDLSDAGRQPMVSETGRYVVTYNGEIYNFERLRKELTDVSAIAWRGRSDTEVLLQAVAHQGVYNALGRINGMFAFAVWDRDAHTLYLARDRAGKKPLYYGWMGDGSLVFASEIRAMVEHPAWEGQLNHNSLVHYLINGNVPAPLSIYRSIHKVRPGTCIAFRIPEGQALPCLTEEYEYWSLGGSDRAASQGTDEEWEERFEQLLRRAVSDRMISDVPLGAFLSGGYDSTAVVALMQAHSAERVKTYTIGFKDNSLDEARYAAEIARYLGTEHTERYVDENDLLDCIPEAITLFDEPFSDSSQIPAYTIARKAREELTVCLTGDGADELLGGYTRYLTARRIWLLLRYIPFKMRPAVTAAIANGAQAVRFRKWPLFRLPELVGAKDAPTINSLLRAHWKDPETVVKEKTDIPAIAPLGDCIASRRHCYEQMMCDDFHTYLPDDVLTKVDRTSMAVGLESRSPFLDIRLVEFMSRVPTCLKIRRGERKWLLKKLVHRYIPARLMHRPKQGFRPPLAEWLRGPLKGWASEHLNMDVLEDTGLFETSTVLTKWQQHQNGTADWKNEIWTILAFQEWYKKNAAHTRV